MILVNTQCFPPATGGIETLMYELSSALCAEGLEVLVYADGKNGGTESLPFALKRYSGIKPWRRLRKARDINQLIKLQRIRGLITDSWKSLEYLETSRVPVVLCLAHGSELPLDCTERKARRIILSLDKATVIVANSSFTAGKLRALKAQMERVQIIHPGTTPAPISDPGIDSLVQSELEGYSPVLVTVARLDLRKGHQRILGILPELVQTYPKLLYLIIGDGPAHEPLVKMTREFGLERHVRFTGALYGQMKHAYLAQSDLFVMPCDSYGEQVEGFGMVYIEAAAHGLPCIAGNSGGSVEAVLHEETGLVCCAESSTDLLAAVRRLLLDTTLYQRLSNNARIWATNFDWSQVIRRYVKLLDL